MFASILNPRSLKAAIVLTILAGSSAAFADPSPAADPIPTVETIVSQSVDCALVFSVLSSGCTTKEDFEIRNYRTFPATLELVRIKPDLCRALPRPIDIAFTYKELHMKCGERFSVSNPVAGQGQINR